MSDAPDGPVAVDAATLKKAKDDTVAAHIKVLENFYSFLISFALTQATMKLADSWIENGVSTKMLGTGVLYISLLVTIVPFYQGMNRFFYETHVVRPIAKPGSRSSPMLLDIYAFLLMGCILFAMGRFLADPFTFFYLWTALLVIDIAWAIAVWRIQASRQPIWAWNNLLFLSLAWGFWLFTRAITMPPCLAGIERLLPYGFVLFEIGRTVRDYRINWKYYFPAEYRGF
jgi:hypothetical protein